MSGTQDAILSLRDIEFYYRPDRKILQSLSLDVKRGTKNVVLGSNGAGKSTLFFSIKWSV